VDRKLKRQKNDKGGTTKDTKSIRENKFRSRSSDPASQSHQHEDFRLEFSFFASVMFVSFVVPLFLIEWPEGATKNDERREINSSWFRPKAGLGFICGLWSYSRLSCWQNYACTC